MAVFIFIDSLDHFSCWRAKKQAPRNILAKNLPQNTKRDVGVPKRDDFALLWRGRLLYQHRESMEGSRHWRLPY